MRAQEANKMLKTQQNSGLVLIDQCWRTLTVVGLLVINFLKRDAGANERGRGNNRRFSPIS